MHGGHGPFDLQPVPLAQPGWQGAFASGGGLGEGDAEV
jgi:hypothetical protein